MSFITLTGHRHKTTVDLINDMVVLATATQTTVVAETDDERVLVIYPGDTYAMIAVRYPILIEKGLI